MIGGVVSQITSWTDTQIATAVPSGALTGVLRVQQNGAGATVSPSPSPEASPRARLVDMAIGDTRTLQALNASNQPITALAWTSKRSHHRQPLHRRSAHPHRPRHRPR